MPPKNANQKRRKVAADPGESTGGEEALGNVPKTSEDNSRRLRNKKHSGNTASAATVVGDDPQPPADLGLGGIVANILPTQAVAAGATLPSDHDDEVAASGPTSASNNNIAGADVASKPGAEYSQIHENPPSPNSGDPVSDQTTNNLSSAEVADSSINEGNLLTIERSSTTTEEYTDIDIYHPPFTIYQRFISDDKWQVDSTSTTHHNLFPDTGARRKKEVKDNFEWLQPAIRPADVLVARKAYADNYTFKDGFHTIDKSGSHSKYSIPAQIMSRCTNFTTHTVSMNHPLCNVEQTTFFLTKPVANLFNRIQAAALRTHTRSSLKDASLGQDLFICSAYVTANEFITISDDIELIDLVDGHSSKKIWHCSSLEKSDMLSKSVMDAYYSIQETHPDMFTVSPEWLTSKKIFPHIQFLGIVSLYTNQSGSKVTAFRLHSFVLYSFDKKSKSTEVHLALTEARLTASSAPERVLQILQMIQGDVVRSTTLTIKPSVTLSDSVEKAYTSLGFSKTTTATNVHHNVFTRNAILQLSRFTNRIIWGRYGHYISMQEECSLQDSVLNLFCRTVSDLFLHPLDSMHALGVRYDSDKIEDAVSSIMQSSIGIEKNIALCAENIRDLACGLTRIPVSVVTHAIVNRILPMKAEKALYETTLELLQHVSIAMVKPAPYYECFVGDCHFCVLYCEKCQCRFGRTGNIYQTLAEATNAILYHHGLEVTTGLDSLEQDDDLQFLRFKQSLPMHSTPLMTGKFALNVMSAMDPDQDRCKYGTGYLDLSREQKRKNLQYLHNLDEAMRIDTFFAGTERYTNSRDNYTGGFLFSTFDVALQMHFGERVAAKYGGNTDSFKDFAQDLFNARMTGDEWIESNCDPTHSNQHRVILGWSYVISEQFVLNYAYLSKRIHETMESEGREPSFSSDELLLQIGLDERVPELQSCFQGYSMLSENITDFDITLCDRVTTVNMTTCHIKRPHLDTVDDSIVERGTVSKLGAGWDNCNRLSWFAGKNDSNTSVHERKIASLLEAEESVLILKTLHSVTLDYESVNEGRGYSMTCKVDDILKKNPSLRDGRFKTFFEKPTFECSNSFITSLPLSFVKKLSVGKPTHLPKEWKAAVKRDAQLSGSIMTSIQLWRHSRIIDDHGKWLISRVYRVIYESTNRNQSSTTTANVTERVALMYLRNEP